MRKKWLLIFGEINRKKKTYIVQEQSSNEWAKEKNEWAKEKITQVF